MDFLQARTNMVNQQVRSWFVFNERVLATMQTIPRERFVGEAYQHLAYIDTELPLAENQVMLSPKVVGRALEALAITPDDTVLEIGTGSGYITACLSQLAARVTSVEIHASLLQQADKILSDLQYRHILLEQGNAVEGWESTAPYHAIFVTGSYPLGVPDKLLAQLHPEGGRLFAIDGLVPNMQALIIHRHGSTFQTQSLFETSLPALIHAAQPKQFHF